MNYDIAIIGGGPAGYNAAYRAVESGMNTLLFEPSELGGVCLNQGCIPTKTLLYSAKLLDQSKLAEKYGILGTGQASFDLSKMIGRKNKVVKKLTAGIQMKLQSDGVTIVRSHAKILGETENGIRIGYQEGEYLVSNVLICTGSDTIVPPIKGLNEVDYWTSKEALESTELPASLAIIGGGVIGIEFASFFNSLGVKVTLIEALPEILGNMDAELSKMLRQEYSKKGVAFLLDTMVTEVQQNELVVQKGSQTDRISVDKVLVAVGRKPNVENLGLENLGIAHSKKGIEVNDRMQTNHPRVYASGDVTGFSMLAHTAIREAEVAIANIAGAQESMSYQAIPWVVYTNPELAGVGLSEAELNMNNQPYRLIKLPMAYAGRFVAENEMGNGLSKLLVDADGKILGCHMLGNPASEMIVLAGMAIEKGLTVEDFKQLVFPHPTVGEILHESLYQ